MSFFDFLKLPEGVLGSTPTNECLDPDTMQELEIDILGFLMMALYIGQAVIACNY